MTVSQIWQPGPWGEDLGRPMTGEQLRAMDDARKAAKAAKAKPDPIVPAEVTTAVEAAPTPRRRRKPEARYSSEVHPPQND